MREFRSAQGSSTTRTGVGHACRVQSLHSATSATRRKDRALCCVVPAAKRLLPTQASGPRRPRKPGATWASKQEWTARPSRRPGQCRRELTTRRLAATRSSARVTNAAHSSSCAAAPPRKPLAMDRRLGKVFSAGSQEWVASWQHVCQTWLRKRDKEEGNKQLPAAAQSQRQLSYSIAHRHDHNCMPGWHGALCDLWFGTHLGAFLWRWVHCPARELSRDRHVAPRAAARSTCR